ncbi:hypothetical protein [Streptomyces sp. CC224B]|uniref:hypothetical protein n=1 Tax=Streptomyces sp. CC224B TaxID=3044571 RepID=UPI0024A948F0|nr:hypothetical protein [Streptomyces sp. CC224B]
MEPLSDRPPLDHPAVGQRSHNPSAGPSGAELKDAVNAAILEEIRKAPTAYCDPSPVPLVGAAPPVAQPGRPPMSQKATDASVVMVASGFLTLCVGVAASAVLYFSGEADPVVVGCLTAAPPVTFFSAKGLAKVLGKALKQAVPAQHHHHYNAPVTQDQRTTHTETRAVWSKTINQGGSQ